VLREAFHKIKIKSQYFLADKINENKNILREADVVVVACGVPNLLNSNMIKDNVIIIDGGINKVDGKTVGDVDIKSFENTNAFISPVPGGVGPVTVACLLENVYLSHYESTNLVQIYK
jgi:methylenetetrahydrofolate dehydrogenase (NADP+)/methenyltetrahydrofolate cyclohydrolase